MIVILSTNVSACVLQCVAVCRSILQCVQCHDCDPVHQCVRLFVAVCSSVMQCVAGCSMSCT